MNEHEPKEQVQAKLDRGAKLRAMVESPGWKEIFRPHIEAEIEGFRRTILTQDFPDLVSLKVNQEKLQYCEHMLDYVRVEIAIADKIISEENRKANVRNQTT